VEHGGEGDSEAGKENPRGPQLQQECPGPDTCRHEPVDRGDAVALEGLLEQELELQIDQRPCDRQRDQSERHQAEQVAARHGLEAPTRTGEEGDERVLLASGLLDFLERLVDQPEEGDTGEQEEERDPEQVLGPEPDRRRRHGHSARDSSDGCAYAK
jgi:hypothetical protein